MFVSQGQRLYETRRFQLVLPPQTHALRSHPVQRGALHLQVDVTSVQCRGVMLPLNSDWTQLWHGRIP